jgi:hypothetical protein
MTQIHKEKQKYIAAIRSIHVELMREGKSGDEVV